MKKKSNPMDILLRIGFEISKREKNLFWTSFFNKISTFGIVLPIENFLLISNSDKII